MTNDSLSEVWKEIQGYDGLYSVSNLGRVLSKHRNRWCFLHQRVNDKGYLQVNLCKNGKSITFKVHRLVAEHFIPNPKKFCEVNHINENKTDNHVDNLEWCDRQYNVTHGTRTDRQSRAISKPVVQFTKSGIPLKEYPSETQAANDLNLSSSSISECCRGVRKTIGGFKWAFKEAQT